MNGTACAGYSALRDRACRTPGEALRAGGAAEVDAALRALRADTLALVRSFREALGPALAVPRRDGLNPPLWELGHIAWFQQRWIMRNPQRGRGMRCDPEAPRAPSQLPEADAWYDSSTQPHALRWALPLPGLDATLDWLSATLEETRSLLAQAADRAGSAPTDDALYFFRLVALHEAMHVEAWRYMARALGIDAPIAQRSSQPLSAPPQTVRPATLRPGAPPQQQRHSPAAPEALHVPPCTWTSGWVADRGFAFDNEVPPRSVQLGDFEIDAQPVSWSRFQAFVQAGGYDTPECWTRQGWEWRRSMRPPQPRFPSSELPAVHLSAHEGEAWCRWAGRRLPTEFEWECAAHTHPAFAWGAVWEWTASPFAPHPGFEAHPYRDYSAPWFGTHRVLRGASSATPDCLVHPRFRNFFLPGRTDILAGFRSCA
ncbi:SUMF1/EgtB/PvdO family nonheme iron enzyme [Ramlibacter sp. AN1015]|uniref:SUMF1/EgtB/PvdO family nonheme iron enzyme n=1 Tax=Ramlibacter sp. AN1015 TaxID=3133428 RepID=UPI0030C157A2